MEVEGYTISFNRGDQVTINVKNRSNCVFEIGDSVKFSIMKKGDCNTVIFQKSYTVEEESNVFSIVLTSDETRFGPALKSGFRTYWYEIEHNGIITLIGYDKKGPKELILYPEAGNKEANE